MPDLPPELAQLLAGLSPEQRQTFMTLFRDASDEQSFNRELAKHPELLAALQGAAPSAQADTPAELLT